MQPHEIHHIKAYVVFFLLSASLIGVLGYLYIPIGSKNFFGSSALQEISPPITVPEPWAQTNTPQEPVNIVFPPISESEASQRRMRLVKILIRYQKELQTLESQRSASPQWLDPSVEEKIKTIRENITTIEKRITEIK